MKYQFTKHQRIAILWLAVFTVLCIVNSFLVTAFVRSGEDAFAAVCLPPFIHLGLIVVSVMVHRALRVTAGISNDERYIKDLKLTDLMLRGVFPIA